MPPVAFFFFLPLLASGGARPPALALLATGGARPPTLAGFFASLLLAGAFDPLLGGANPPKGGAKPEFFFGFFFLPGFAAGCGEDEAGVGIRVGAGAAGAGFAGCAYDKEMYPRKADDQVLSKMKKTTSEENSDYRL